MPAKKKDDEPDYPTGTEFQTGAEWRDTDGQIYQLTESGWQWVRDNPEGKRKS